MPTPSPNFSYLAYFGAPLVEAAAHAEQVISLDPVGALVHLRRFGELLAKSAAARLGVDDRGNDEQVERLRRLEQRSLSDTVLRLFHSLRQLGNRAAHDGIGTQQDAFTQLKIARELAIWFQRSFGNDRKFDPGPFVPPRDLRADTESLASELDTLAEQAPADQQAALMSQASQAAAVVNLDEAATRALIDQQLRDGLDRGYEGSAVSRRCASAKRQVLGHRGVAYGSRACGLCFVRRVDGAWRRGSEEGA